MKLLESFPRISARNLIVIIFNGKARPKMSTMSFFFANVRDTVMDTELIEKTRYSIVCKYIDFSACITNPVKSRRFINLFVNMFCMHNPSVSATLINLSKYPAKVEFCLPISDNGGFKASAKVLGPSVYPFGKTVHLYQMPQWMNLSSF